MQFLEQEGCQLVVEFWQTATVFQHHLRPESDPTTSQNEAINIYDKWVFGLILSADISLQYLVTALLCYTLKIWFYGLVSFELAQYNSEAYASVYALRLAVYM